MKTADVRERMGVFKRIEDVPNRYRLENHARGYRERDIWGEFVEGEADSDYLRETLERAGRSWCGFMQDQGKHPAFAHPIEVEEWAVSLREERGDQTAYNRYFLQVEKFYSWLQWHTEFPHRYHPVWMAVVEFSASRELWSRKRAGVSDDG